MPNSEVYKDMSKILKYIQKSDYETISTNFYQNVIVLTPNKITADMLLEELVREFGNLFHCVRITDSRFVLYSVKDTLI